MRNLKIIIVLPLLVLTVHCNAGDSPLGSEEDYKPPSRILFVGNSLTGFNDGVDTHLAGLVDAADSLPDITADVVWSAGASFRNHWFNDNTKNMIWNGEWDTVILQEHSRLSITDTENMYTYARLLDELIRKSGASTVFFMTWAWRDEPEMIDQLVPVYQGIADELVASLAPVGLAWRRSLEENPDLDLYNEDGYHPNYRGTYLSACVFYALLWRRNPEGIPYYGPGSVTPAEGKFLQRIAWETVMDSGAFRYQGFSNGGAAVDPKSCCISSFALWNCMDFGGRFSITDALFPEDDESHALVERPRCD